MIALLTAVLIVAPTPRFVDATGALGLDVTFRSGTVSSLSAGIAFFELDSDGWPDLVVADVAGTDTVYRNQGPPDFAFEPIEIPALAAPLQTHALLAADLVGDAAVDLLLLPVTSARSPTLLVGQLDGSFADESATRLLLPRSVFFSATAGDFDQDGDLDVVLTRWAATVPVEAGDCVDGVFVRNTGGRLMADPGVSEALTGCGLTVLATRLAGGSALDLVQINDFGPWLAGNAVLRNEGLDPSGLPRLVPLEHGLAAGVFGMGGAVGDLNGDLLLDHFATSLGEDLLLLGTADGGAQDATDRWRAGTRYGDRNYKWKWGAAFFDSNNSGDSDLVVLAGEVMAWPISQDDQPGSLLLNTGEPPLVDVAPQAGLALTTADRTLSVADLDGDGRLDLAVSGIETSRVFRNQTEQAGHWVGLRLAGTVSDPHAIGARVLVSCGERQWLREQTGGGSVGGSPGRGVHVGLGDCSGAVSADVTWPAGRTSHHDLDLDVWQGIVEPEWLVLSATTVTAGSPEAIEVRWTPAAGEGEVTWTSTAGEIATAALEVAADGTRVGQLLPAADPGEAILSFRVDGQPSRVHPRIRFTHPVDTLWAQHPMPAVAGDPVRIGLRIPEAEGAVELSVEGGTWLEEPQATAGGWVGVALGDPGSAELRFRARVGGAEVGHPWTAPLQPRVDASRGRIQLHREAQGGLVRVEVILRDGAGALVSSPALASDLELQVDGAPVAGEFHAGVAFEGNGDARIFAARIPEVDLAGEITVSHDGTPVAAAVRLPPPDIGPEQLDPSRSAIVFFERHGYADGEDVIPLRVLLRDAGGIDLPVPTERVSLDVVGGELLSIQPFFDVVHWAILWVRPAAGHSVLSAALLFDGEPVGVQASLPLLARGPAGPDVDTIDVALFDPLELTPIEGIRVGSAGAALELVPRDAAGARSGAGAGLSVELDPGVVGDLSHVGLGAWVAAVAPWDKACTATLRIRTATPWTEREVALHYLSADGAVVDAPCAADPGGCGAGDRPGRGPTSALLLGLILAAWLSRLRCVRQGP